MIGKENFHYPLPGALDVTGPANLREFLWYIYHADGVICCITAAMHIAAALQRPCVVVAGGREHWWWEAYVNTSMQTFGPKAAPVPVPHRYLHTQDLLPCCMGRGCWKNKVTRAEKDKPGYYCHDPVDDGYGQIIPQCLNMITPEMVVDAVCSYYPGDDPYHGTVEQSDVSDLPVTGGVSAAHQ